MIYQVFTVKDLKAAAFAPPFFLPRVEVAIRTFRDALRDPQHPMAAHPEDYVLYSIGEFDDETGLIEPVDQPVFVSTSMPDPDNPARDLAGNDLEQAHG